MPADPTPEQIRAFLADCNLRRAGWAGFQHGTRYATLRMLRTMTEEASMSRTPRPHVFKPSREPGSHGQIYCLICGRTKGKCPNTAPAGR